MAASGAGKLDLSFVLQDSKRARAWHLRWYYTMMRRMFGKVSRQQKYRCDGRPGIVCGSVAMEGGLAKKRKRLGARCEWTSILP